MTPVHIFKHPKYSEVSSVKSSLVMVTLEAEELLVIGWLLYFRLPYVSVQIRKLTESPVSVKLLQAVSGY